MSADMTGRKAFAVAAIVEALSIVPLAFFLPFSAVALVSAVGILAALNASLFVTNSKGAWLGFLEFMNLGICAACLELALRQGYRSLLFPILAIALLCLLLFILGVLGLPNRMLKRCFAAQQVALASTAIFWLVIRHFGPVFEASGIISVDHFRTGLRLLFAGPLALVAVAFFAGFAEGKRHLIISLVGICAGQWAVGFFELGVELQVYALIVAGFLLTGTFLLLLVLAVRSGRNPSG